MEVWKHEKNHKYKESLSYEIEWSVETAFAVHVLTVLALQNNVYLTDIISLDFFTFGRVESSKTHGL